MLDNKTAICMVPFRELHVNTHGKFRNCCIQKEVMGRLDLRVENPNNWFAQEPSMNMLRKDLKADVKNSICDKCWRLEDQGLSSYRINWNNQYNQRSDTTLESRIEVLDLRLGNRCNLKCRMCNSTWSNLISSQIEELKSMGIHNTYTQMPVTGIIKQADSFIDELFEFVKKTPTIREIKFAGGEPFAMEEVEEFLYRLVEEGRTNIEISITTNTTLVKDRVVEALEKFESTHIQCSIDGVGELLEYQRYPCKWEVVERSFKKLYDANLTVNLTPCWSNLNILSIADFLEWTAQFPNSHVAYNEVNTPSYLDWKLVPLEARQEVLFKLRSIDFHPRVHKDYKKFIDKFAEEVRDYTREELVQYSDAIVSWNALSKIKYQDIYDWNTKILNRL
jgi:sulfatase maturation enzyme AslB (radical SAM superfamily)